MDSRRASSRPLSSQPVPYSIPGSCGRTGRTSSCDPSTGDLREFEYQIDMDRFLRIVCPDRSAPESLDARVLLYDKQTSAVAIRGRIDEQHPSVVAAIDAAGETIQLAMALADIFGGQIDFDSDLQPGDSFEVLFEKSSHDGQFAGYGAVLGARFVTDGRDLRAFRWTDPATGQAGFYDENGRSLKRFFLRSPLQVRAAHDVRFSRSRLHPVFRTYRAHLGVDYARPAGRAGRRGRERARSSRRAGAAAAATWCASGTRAASRATTCTCPRSAPGIRAGAHVDQGQLIGRVGSTGTATGPHLDYRLKKNGVFVESARRAPQAAARRADPGASTRGLRRRCAIDVLEQLATALVAADAPGSDAAVVALAATDAARCTRARLARERTTIIGWLRSIRSAPCGRRRTRPRRSPRFPTTSSAPTKRGSSRPAIR